MERPQGPARAVRPACRPFPSAGTKSLRHVCYARRRSDARLAPGSAAPFRACFPGPDWERSATRRSAPRRVSGDCRG